MKNADKKKHDLKKSLIQTTIDMVIREIPEDPGRSFRKLADLGRRFAVNSKQRELFDTFIRLLSADNSPYYQALGSLFELFDPAYVKTVGINIGYESILAGESLRQTAKKQTGVLLPWSYLFCLSPDFSPEELEAKVREGSPQGIRTFLLVSDPDAQADKAAGEAAKTGAAFPDCAFILFLPDSPLHPESVSLLEKARNVSCSVPLSGRFSQANAALFQKKRMIYASGVNYRDNSCLDTEVFDAALASGTPFLIFTAEPGCPEPIRAEIAARIASMRLEPRLPLFLFDLYGDLQAISDYMEIEKTPVFTL